MTNPAETTEMFGIPLREIQLASEERRLAAFIEALPVAVFVTDAAGTPLYSNEQSRRLLGRGVVPGTESKHLAETYQAYIVGTNELYPIDRMPLVRALKGVSCTVDDIEIHRGDRRIPLEVDGAPLLGASGEVLYAIAIFHDISERRAMERRLRVSDRMATVGVMAAGVAHEINNPLSYLTANLTFALAELKSGSGNVAEVISALDDAHAGAVRMGLIVRDLKTFSRDDDGQPVAVDLHNVLEVALRLSGNDIRHRARLVKDLGPLPWVMGNESRLGQVFLNLLVNAAQAIPEGRADANEIRVVTRVDASGRPIVEISDTGAGIDPKLLTRIFEPFFTTKPKGVGTGLGLAICNDILVGLGAELTVESELGKGTTFRVCLRPAPPPE